MANNNHFELTLDTMAPSGSITANRYYKENGTVTIVKGDASFMCVWFDANSTGTRPTSPTWVAASESASTTFSQDGNYYYHLILMDDVGNESQVFNSGITTFDKTLPEVTLVQIDDGAAYTTDRTVDVYFEFNDPSISGIQNGSIRGNLVGSPIAVTFSDAETNSGKATRTVTFTDDAEEGEQFIYVKVTDKAGNVSSEGQDSIILDTTGAVAHVALYNTNDTATVTEFINYVNVTARVDASGASDWKDYKVWVSTSTEPSTWTEVTAADIAAGHVSVPLTLTTGDGVKTVYAKVRDKAQAEAGENPDATSTSVKLDQTKPVASIAFSSGTVIKDNIAYISEVAGYNTVTIIPTVVEEYSGQKSYTLYNGTTSLRTGSGNVPASFVIPVADLGAEGQKSLTLSVTDKAENEQTSAAIILIVDKTAPVAGNPVVDAYLGGANVESPFHKFSEAGATASASDTGAGIKTMICWCDTSSTASTIPGTARTNDYAENPTHNDIDWTNHQESTDNYVHIKYIDAVGNATIVTSNKFCIDTEAPENGGVEFTKDVYSSASAQVNLTYGDGTSGVASYKIWGNITAAATEAAATWTNISTPVSLTLSGADGNKTVNVRYRDKAGNVSLLAVTDTTELDTTAPSATLVLRKPDDSADKDSPSNVAEFKARIAGWDDGTTEGTAVKYVLYGDFTENEQKSQGIPKPDLGVEANWKTLSMESGKGYMTISNLFCTSNAEKGVVNKKVYLYVKDNAGNVYPHKDDFTVPADSGLMVAFDYDTKEPEVTVSDVDYQRISTVQTLRRNSSGEIAGKYNDQTNFKFTPNETIQAYQVCAYETQEEATAGDHTKGKVQEDERCTNMSASGISISGNTSINSTISGAALKATCPSGDGVKYVVVYVQDLGGTWSVAAKFTA